MVKRLLKKIQRNFRKRKQQKRRMRALIKYYGVRP